MAAKKEKYDMRLELANKIIAQMERGDNQWQKPWEAGDIMPPTNAVTGNPYRGVNYQTLMLFSPDPTDNRWCTFLQAKEKGWKIRKGAKALPIEKWNVWEKERTPEEIAKIQAERDKLPPEKRVKFGEIEEVERRAGKTIAWVFHASQIEGIPPLERAPKPEISGEPDPRIAQLAQEMGVEVTHSGGRAFYRATDDRVNLPPVASFHTATGYDTTFLHELSHATGHESRLNREMGSDFGSEKYALEELRAEMSAAMTAASLGIGFDPSAQDREEGREMTNSAAYLAGWLQALPDKDRKQIIMQTIKDAQAMSDYLLQRTPELVVIVERSEPEKELDKDLSAFLAERNHVRQGEHPGYAGLSDPVANAEHFVSDFAQKNPDKAKEWAQTIREDMPGYSKAAGLSPDSLSAIASQMEAGAQTVEHQEPERPARNLYEEQQQSRKERFLELAEKAREEAARKMGTADERAAVMPMGQPILAGHHSEKGHRRAVEQIQNTFGKGVDLLNKAEYYENRAKSVENNRNVSADDPEALDKIKKRADVLQQSIDKMKLANEVIQQHAKDGPEAQRAALEAAGFKQELAQKIMQSPDRMGRIGFCQDTIDANKDKVKRLEKRIKELEKAENRQDRKTEFSWGMLRENKGMNRIQFLFNETPNEEVRDLLKGNGYKWAPSEEAWQRQWTDAAERTTQRMVKILEEKYPSQKIDTSKVLSEPIKTSDLGESLKTLGNKKLDLPNGKKIEAKKYLEMGIARGFTVLPEPDGFTWGKPDGSKGVKIADPQVATIVRAAQAKGPDVTQTLRQALAQKEQQKSQGITLA